VRQGWHRAPQINGPATRNIHHALPPSRGLCRPPPRAPLYHLLLRPEAISFSYRRDIQSATTAQALLPALRRLPLLFLTFAQPPPYLVVFSLDTTGLSRHNPRQHPVPKLRVRSHSRRSRETQEPGGADRKNRCNTCPASRYSASMHSVKPADVGCAPTSLTLRARTAVAPAAATSFALSRHHSAPISVCVRARSPRAHPCAPGPVKKLSGPFPTIPACSFLAEL